MDERVQEPLLELCTSINNEIENSNGCGGLVVTDGYISYDSQKILYEDSDEELSKPGHDEHQLGLAIDFAINGLLEDSFELSEQSEWLKNHAWEYGFVETTNESYHYRYVGIEAASAMHDEQGISLKEYNENKK